MSGLEYDFLFESMSGVKVCFEKDGQEIAYDQYERYDFLQRQVFTHLINDIYKPLRTEIFEVLRTNKNRNGITVELGCGLGSEIYEFANNFSFQKCIGVDTSLRFLDHAQQLFVEGKSKAFSLDYFGLTEQKFQFQKADNVEFCLARAEDLPFADNSIDLIVNFFLFDRVKDPVKLVEEVHRVLRPGGLVISVTPFNFSNLMLRNRFGTANKLNLLFEQNGLYEDKDSINLLIEEPLDIAGNKIIWNTDLFFHSKVG